MKTNKKTCWIFIEYETQLSIENAEHMVDGICNAPLWKQRINTSFHVHHIHTPAGSLARNDSHFHQNSGPKRVCVCDPKDIELFVPKVKAAR